MRQLWNLNLGWDKPLPEHELSDWNAYIQDLKMTSNIKIPRWIGINSKRRWIEVHGFSDASKDAYAAVVYIRALTEGGEVVCRMVTSKTRIAPQAKPPKKPLSIARLELCGAVLLCKLVQFVIGSLHLETSPVHLWTDSRVALHWIHDEPARWLLFIAHRVQQIQQTLPIAQWHHIDGTDNPADCASRGITTRQLSVHSLWWHGPKRLTETAEPWRISEPLVAASEPEEELKTVHLNIAAEPQVWDLCFAHSSLTNLLRQTAWCQRYLSRLRRAVQRREHAADEHEEEPISITPREIDAARVYWVRAVQSAEFGEEKRIINERKPLPGRKLAKLSPFIDNEGLLRVGGRLKHSLLDWDEVHPVILPSNHYFTKLVIEDCHARTLHGGTQLVLTVLRRKYWVMSGRSTVKAIIHRCLTCIRFRAAAAEQRMGDLPPVRVQRSRVFEHAGVDFAGPFSIRTSKGRGNKSSKGYICLFICLVTRAVHLEAVSDYSTTTFIAAYRRFVSRKGICKTIMSDQGTNFVGADNELQRMFRKSSREFQTIFKSLADNGTEWRFNPPAAPNFGGIWEAAVKSTKHHLKRVIHDYTLTYEEFSTILCEIEACLNSRPLCKLTDDPEDMAVLTPGRFLAQEQVTTVPGPPLAGIPPARLSRWQLTQQITEYFWERWQHEHLQDLQERTRWLYDKPPVRVGDLAILKTETLPPARWPIVRITETHPGSDGHVRVVTIRTPDTTLKRSISKLVMIPRAPEDERAHG